MAKDKPQKRKWRTACHKAGAAFDEGCTYFEIAAVLGITRNQLREHMTRHHVYRRLIGPRSEHVMREIAELKAAIPPDTRTPGQAALGEPLVGRRAIDGIKHGRERVPCLYPQVTLSKRFWKSEKDMEERI